MLPHAEGTFLLGVCVCFVLQGALIGGILCVGIPGGLERICSISTKQASGHDTLQIILSYHLEIFWMIHKHKVEFRFI